MRAFVLDRYGSPDRFQLTDLDRPEPAAGEVLVRVRATSINPYDWHHMRGEPLLARPSMGGPRRPRHRVLGCDLAGEVAAVGTGVTGFEPGDRVYALVDSGGFAEYATVPVRLLARMPANLTYEQAAAVPMAGVTALLAVRDDGGVRSGSAVLVNGATGGVGTFAVQIAAAYGAKVTAVCRGRNADLVRSIGADEVIDYTVEDFTRSARRYDVLLDVAGSRPVRACRRVLVPDGTLVAVGGPAGRWVQPAGHVLGAAATGLFVSQRMVRADAVRSERRQKLDTLTGLIEAGQVTPVVDRTYRFEDLPDAVRHQEAGHSPGKVVVTV